MATCLVLAWNTGLTDKYVAPMLSHQSFGGLGRGTLSSWRREQSQNNSVAVLATDLYSASVEGLDTVGCFLELQEIKWKA
jgi:hypothetical protein